MVSLHQSRKQRADQNHSFLKAPPDSQISATNPLTHLLTHSLIHLHPSTHPSSLSSFHLSILPCIQPASQPSATTLQFIHSTTHAYIRLPKYPPPPFAHPSKRCPLSHPRVHLLTYPPTHSPTNPHMHPLPTHPGILPLLHTYAPPHVHRSMSM